MSTKFDRTRAALQVYDDFLANVWEPGTNEDFGRRFLEHEAKRIGLSRLVGRAFGEDTSDVNSIETCERYVTPTAVRKFLVNESWADTKGSW